jgi:cell division protease FtsH
MANDNRQGPDVKKGFPGGFLLLFLAAILIFLGVQSLTSEGAGKVAFSHQAEYLTDLNLIVPEENRKIAQNDNLVTFSGKFRDTLPADSTDRYKYLELLNKNHELQGEESRLLAELTVLQKNVQDSSDLFLRLSDQDLKNGYTVVGTLYDTPERQSSVVIRNLSSGDVVNQNVAASALDAALQDPSPENVDEARKEISDLLALLRSPALGIGSESVKAELKAMSDRMQKVSGSSLEQQLVVYRNTLGQISSTIADIGRETEGVRLSQLRSVRSYISSLQQYNQVALDQEQNEVLLDKSRQKVSGVIWFFNNQELSTRALEKQDPEVFEHWFSGVKQEWEGFEANKGLRYSAPDQPRNTVLEKTFKSQEPAPNYFSYLFTVLPVLLVIVFLYFIFSKQMKGVGSNAMSFGKSPAKLMLKENNKITFKDVAGVEEAKEELSEIVDFLKDPQKYTALGAKIPKGVLLVGPPGTGKTLMAKAVAGEADRPFFSISGSDFVEMFVGVGASRIRDMFETAKKSAPCIIFMDEIDAVGRHRGAGIGGGHDEREQTLNQLLVEMDGFDTKEGVILMAATNRPDVLDKALLRPGRFDRRVTLDLPDVKGRLEILKVHARKIKIDASVDLSNIAKKTPGTSGAELANIINEAALSAARKGRSAVTSVELKDACDKVRFGKERRSMEMDEGEKKTTAYHESGHAVASLVVKHSDPVEKETIIPQGFSLGATHFLPRKNRLSYWRKEILDQLIVLLGGRAAEEIFVFDMSSGASQDIAQATRLARCMVCEWGMCDELGTIAYDERSGGENYLGGSGYKEKSYSDETAKRIDAEVLKLVSTAHKEAVEILTIHKDKVQLMTDLLMEFETLDATDVMEIMEGKWSTEEKRARLKAAEDLQRKTPPPLPSKEPTKSIDPTHLEGQEPDLTA